MPVLTFSVGGKVRKYDVEKHVKIELENLQKNIVEHPSEFAYINSVYAAYKAKVEKLKVLIDRKYAELFMKVRGSGEKVTDKYVSAYIHSHPEYQELEDAYLHTLKMEKQLQVVIEAFKHRIELLVVLDNDERAERRADRAERR